MHRRDACRANQAADHWSLRTAESDCVMATFLLLALFLCTTTGGEIAMTYGMKATGEPERLRPKQVLRFLGRAVCSGWFWVGIPLMAISFYLLLILLSWQPISFVI